MNNGNGSATPGQGQGHAGGGNADDHACLNSQCRARQRMLDAEIAQLRHGVNQLGDQADTLRSENRMLKVEVARLKAKLGSGGLHHERTWPERLRIYLRNSHGDARIYREIYLLCCKEENMSTKVNFVHPDLILVPPRARRLAEWDGLAPGDTRPQALPAPDDAVPFPFEKLPWQVQEEILKLVLHKPGQLIHCLSRLDPFAQPSSIPTDEQLGAHKSGLPKRFFWGRQTCSVSRDGADPQKLLAVLGVSKRLLFLGVHLFYGLNTFAFSSLGEFGRFCAGVGTARLARVQHVELLWTGSQRLTCPPDDRGRTPMSRRTYPLSWLADMPRLRSLVVHVNETARAYARRGYEHPQVKHLLHARTLGQPNRRMARALRLLQGLDYVSQLRGLDAIRFYDFSRVLRSGRNVGVRVPVQDWSFSEEMARMTTMPKTGRREARAALEALEPLFRQDVEQNWTPGAEDWRLVRRALSSRAARRSYDDLWRERQGREDELASCFGGSSARRSECSSRWAGGDGTRFSGADSDSESGGSSGPPGAGQRRGRSSSVFIKSEDPDSVKHSHTDDSSSPRSSPSGATSGLRSADVKSDSDASDVDPSDAVSLVHSYAVSDLSSSDTADTGPAATAGVNRGDSIFVTPGPPSPPAPTVRAAASPPAPAPARTATPVSLRAANPARNPQPPRPDPSPKSESAPAPDHAPRAGRSSAPSTYPNTNPGTRPNTNTNSGTRPDTNPGRSPSADPPASPWSRARYRDRSDDRASDAKSAPASRSLARSRSRSRSPLSRYRSRAAAGTGGRQSGQGFFTRLLAGWKADSESEAGLGSDVEMKDEDEDGDTDEDGDGDGDGDTDGDGDGDGDTDGDGDGDGNTDGDMGGDTDGVISIDSDTDGEMSDGELSLGDVSSLFEGFGDLDSEDDKDGGDDEDDEDGDGSDGIEDIEMDEFDDSDGMGDIAVDEADSDDMADDEDTDGWDGLGDIDMDEDEDGSEGTGDTDLDMDSETDGGDE